MTNESFDEKNFEIIREAVCRMMADPGVKATEQTTIGPSVSERPSVDWSVLKNDLDGLSAEQLTLVLDLIEEMKRANTRYNEDKP